MVMPSSHGRPMSAPRPRRVGMVLVHRHLAGVGVPSRERPRRSGGRDRRSVPLLDIMFVDDGVFVPGIPLALAVLVRLATSVAPAPATGVIIAREGAFLALSAGMPAVALQFAC